MTDARRPDDLERFDRQTRLKALGREGQERLAASRVLIVGCGALGGVAAEILARAGVGFLRVVDRDLVEASNLHRQFLFSLDDARAQVPKAVAAAQRLRTLQGDAVAIEAHTAHVDAGTIEELGSDVDLILDGTDNFQTRYLINDYAVREGKPWIYGGAVGMEGRQMTIVPGRTACLRCLFEEPPPPGTAATCDTAGVFPPITVTIAAQQAGQALLLLAHPERDPVSRLLVHEFLGDHVRVMRVRRNERCPCCAERTFPFLEAGIETHAETLCGRDTVQIRPAGRSTTLDLEALATRLQNVANARRSPYWVRLDYEDLEITLFEDARAFVRGTEDVSRARSVYSRLLGD
ncbi:MAG: ThiF family adenylyltransferase [Planctomycetes bacterium]|nr:ThiF family adenylyltransferase [Planctomycetota bacterium]